MIIIKVQGGLGNQMLQYSFGKLLEVVYTKEVAYDISFFEDTGKYTKRPYLLDTFKTHVRVATIDEIQATQFPLGIISQCIYTCKKVINKFFLKKYHITYDASLLKKIEKKNRMYIEGFFHSYLYVSPVVEIINEELILKETLSEKLSSLDTEIRSSESVFVHIRRGDYLNGGADLQVLDKEYYKRAVEEINSRVQSPRYYIFSDDSEWVKREMDELFRGTLYVSEYGFKDYEEFFLMSHTKHGIIANSTFSWWGAMLNLHTDKVIICPKDWKNVHLTGDTHLCPPDWIAV